MTHRPTTLSDIDTIVRTASAISIDRSTPPAGISNQVAPVTFAKDSNSSKEGKRLGWLTTRDGGTGILLDSTASASNRMSKALGLLLDGGGDSILSTPISPINALVVEFPASLGGREASFYDRDTSGRGFSTHFSTATLPDGTYFASTEEHRKARTTDPADDSAPILDLSTVTALLGGWASLYGHRGAKIPSLINTTVVGHAVGSPENINRMYGTRGDAYSSTYADSLTLDKLRDAAEFNPTEVNTEKTGDPKGSSIQLSTIPVSQGRDTVTVTEVWRHSVISLGLLRNIRIKGDDEATRNTRAALLILLLLVEQASLRDLTLRAGCNLVHDASKDIVRLDTEELVLPDPEQLADLLAEAVKRPGVRGFDGKLTKLTGNAIIAQAEAAAKKDKKDKA